MLCTDASMNWLKMIFLILFAEKKHTHTLFMKYRFSVLLIRYASYALGHNHTFRETHQENEEKKCLFLYRRKIYYTCFADEKHLPAPFKRNLIFLMPMKSSNNLKFLFLRQP